MRTLPLLLLLPACVDPVAQRAGPDWDPFAAAVLDTSLVFVTPYSGRLVRVASDGTVEPIDLGGARVTRVEAAPDGRTLLVRAVRTSCDPTVDPKADRRRFVDQCPYAARVDDDRLLILRDDQTVTDLPFPPWFGDWRFAPDGRFAAALLDADRVTSGAGLVNLAAMRFLDLEAGATWEVSVGFDATGVQFLPPGGPTTQALVLAPGEVDLIDLTAAFPDPDVVFPLSLDADTPLLPSQVSASPDGAYAMVSTTTVPDLYVLDLAGRSINIVGLPQVAARLLPDPTRDRTLVTYPQRAAVDRLDHDRFELDPIPLDDAADELILRGDLAIGWSTRGGRDVARIDLRDDTVTEYRLNYAPSRVVVDASGTIALSLASAPNDRAELLELTPDGGRLDADPRPFALDATPLDAWLTPSDDGIQAWILQESEARLLSLQWPSLDTAAIDLPAPAERLGPLTDGTLYAIHADPQGTVTFVTPAGDATTVDDIALVGALDRIPLEAR